MKKKSFIIRTFLLVLLLVLLILAQTVYADVLTDLGFSTSSQDLENYDQRANSQPYNSKNITISPVLELYLVEIQEDPDSPGETWLKRTLKGDNNLGDISETIPMDSDAAIKYVKAAALDISDSGKKHAVAELYYRDGSHGKGEIYLTIMDPAASLTDPVCDEVLVFSNSETDGPLITDYRNQHTFLSLVTGDFDNDGVDEIVVYVPDADNPRLALYKVVDKVIEATPAETFVLPGFSEFVYMTTGDITGDNLADLAVSYNASGTFENVSKAVYIFKSQDFSLSRPHIFNRLAASYNGGDHFISGIPNASVAIGNLAGEPGDVQMELEIAGRWEKYYYTSALGYRYSETTGDWDFEIVQSRTQHDMSHHVGFKDLNRNVLTTLACYGTYGQRSEIYIDGLWDFRSNYQKNDERYEYVDYGVVTGNFSGYLHYRFEELAILRERLYYHGSTDEYERVCWEVAGWVTLDDNTICAALAAPDTDDDTVIMKYVGHELQYSSPTILAALASPPYFEDLEHLDGGDGYIGGSSTEISSGEGSGSETHGSVNVTAGAYGRVEGEVSFFGIKIAQSECEEAFTVGYSWDTSHETEVTTSISYGTLGGQDSVAVYTIPMDVFKYEMWCPGVGGKGGYWTNLNQYFPYPAAYVVIPVDKYDEIASREPDLPRIGGELFQHTLGRPETYHRSSAEMYKIKDPIEHNKFTTVGYGDAYTVQSVEITESSTNSHTFSANMSYRVGGGVAGAIVGITFDIGGGGGWSTSTIKNVGYTGTLANMPREAEDGGYSYAWKLVAYPYISDKGDQSFPVVTYAVDQIRRPPLLPQNMEMTDATPNSVTLTWDNVDPNVTGYQLYRYYDFEGGLAGYKKIGDVIPVGTTNYTDVDLQPYTYYSYKIQSIGSPYGGVVGKSILGSECSARTAPEGDAPLITQQPVSVEAASGTRAVFQVIAQPATGAAVSDRIFYQWQRYADGRWQTMKYEEDNLLTINGVRQENAGRYRCAISQYVQDTPITIYSNPVTLTVSKNNLSVVLSFEPNEGYGDRNELVTVTAKLKDIDVEIQPTGKINLVFISYPDPYVTVKEDGSQEIEYPDPISYFHEVELVDGKGQMDWRPADYGSYDIMAVYLGDNNYHQQISDTESFICVSDESESVSGLRITGMPGNIMSYGATADLGATVWRNGMVQTIMADEVEFLSSDPEGLELIKSGGTNPQWHITAKKAGSYMLTAEINGIRTLKVSRPITVNKVQVALKVKDQNISQGSEPGPIELELIEGELKLGDSLPDVFDFVSWHTVSDITPPGVYDIFIDRVTQRGDNYIITGVGGGTITVDGSAYNIKFRGVSNGTVTALINGWKVLGQNYTAGYDIVAGSAVRFNAIPVVGYKVEKWVLNGTEVKKEDGSYDTSAYITNNDLNVNISVEVYFVPNQCLLTYSAGANGTLSAKVGSLSVGNGATLPAQTVVGFQATPNEGYMVSQWKINNSPLSDYTQDSYNHTVTRDTDVQVSFASVEYVAISYTAEGNGRVSAQTEQGADVGNNGLVTKGSNVVFTATPNSANSMVKEWVVNGEVVQGGSTVYTAQNIRQAIEVKAIFIDAITYTVTFGAIGHGTEALTAQVDGVAIASGSQVRGYEDVVFTAHPPAGWQVKQWKLGTGIIQDSDGQPLLSETYTLEELKSSVTVSVEFESTYTYRVDYEVKLKEEEGEANGSLTARVTYAGISSNYDSGDEIKPDSRVVLTAVPDSGYTIEEWTVNGVATSNTEPIYIITSIGADYEVTVKFALGTNPLTFAAVGSGKISAESEDGAISSDTILDDGVEVDFAAEPDAGYQVKEWRYNEKKVAGSTDSYTLTVSNGGFVEVEFEREYYTLILGENLSASVEGFDLQDDQVQGDSNVTVTALPPAGYLLTAWYEDGDLLSDEQGDAYSFIMKQDTEITADFAPKSYGVTFDAGMNGTLTVTADGDRIISGAEQPGGCSLIFTAQPSEGYQVSTWYRDLTEVSGEPVEDSRDEIYVIDPLSKPEYIRVYFEQIPDEPVPVEYQVTFAAGNGGSISATADGQAISSGSAVAAGSKLVFTVISDSGKTVDAWDGTENGTLSANKLVFIISSLSGTENVRVTFKNTSNGGGGSDGGGGSSKDRENEDLPPTPAGTLIGGVGGAILENGVTITFPAGAVEDDIRVQVQEVSRSAGLSLPENSRLLSKVVDIVKDASGNFSRPVTITLSFDTAQADPEKFDIQICYYDEESGQWVPLDNIQVNLAGGKVSGDINHFTKFAVLAVPKTVQPATPVQPSLSIPADLAGHWAEDNVMKLMEAGVISGYPDGSLRPNGTISRAEFTVMMVKALKPENGGGKVFADTTSHWAKDSIATAFANGIISGYDENCFGPDDPVTREQVALMITRITGAESSNGLVSFTDSNLISTWAQSGVATAANSGLFVGYPDGSFRPQNNMTRAEAAVIVGRLLETKGYLE